MKIIIRLVILSALIAIFAYNVIQSEAKANPPLKEIMFINGVWQVSKKIGEVYSDSLRRDQQKPKNTKPCDNCANNDAEKKKKDEK